MFVSKSPFGQDSGNRLPLYVKKINTNTQVYAVHSISGVAPSILLNDNISSTPQSKTLHRIFNMKT